MLLDARFKYLCNPALVDGVISSEELDTLPAQKSRRRKAVNFEPKKDSFITNKLYNRLRYAYYFQDRVLN